MNARVQEETELLRKRYPDLRHGDQLDWILLPRLVLPIGRFNKEASRILFRLPVGYPNTGLDNFFVDGDLRLKDGSNPSAFNVGSNSGSGPAPVEDNWGWFSWHPQAWRPAATVEGGDNLVGFVRTINLCLRGEESA